MICDMCYHSEQNRGQSCLLFCSDSTHQTSDTAHSPVICRSSLMTLPL